MGHGPATVTATPRRRQLELQYEGKTFSRDIFLVIPAKDFGSFLDEDSFDPVITETVATPSLHVKGEIPKEGELVVIKDSSTKGWFFLSEVLRVLSNLVEVRYFTTPTPALENYEHCSVQKRSARLSEILRKSKERVGVIASSLFTRFGGRPLEHNSSKTNDNKGDKQM
jgi:hypothetical protein